MLGVFVLAFFFKRVTARGAFYGVLAGEAGIFGCWYFTAIAFLWYNVIGCVVVVVSALAISALSPTPRAVPACALSCRAFSLHIASWSGR